MRWFYSALLALVILMAWGVVHPGGPAARAQDDATAGEETTSSEPPPNLLKHIFESAGPVFGFILGSISIFLVALIVMLAMDLRAGVATPPEFVESFTDTVNKRKFKEAFDLARADNSMLARVLTAGMGRLQYGIEDAREAAFNMVETVRASKDQMITYLATIGTLGPMIGLVGTVYGMILSFMVLSRGGTPNAKELASGISHALVLTLLGVGISVPAIFCHAFFKSRLTQLSLDASNQADDLLTQMYHNSRRPPAAPGPTTAAAAAAPAPVKS